MHKSYSMMYSFIKNLIYILYEENLLIINSIMIAELIYEKKAVKCIRLLTFFASYSRALTNLLVNGVKNSFFIGCWWNL